MGTEQNRAEALRWFRQAEDDLTAVEILTTNEKFAQACFFCQQAAEKAVKSLWFLRGDDPWGHSVLRLIDDLEDAQTREQLAKRRENAMQLDRMYIPTRYPNGLPELLPMQAYGESDAKAAARWTQEIVESIRTLLQL